MPLAVATWNVNGIRARAAQVVDWLARDRPDVVCLQELKATPEQLPETLAALLAYWSCWHGAGPYSGVALLLSRQRFPEPPRFSRPPFDRETRIVEARAGGLVLTSVYVPNGGKDFAAKLEFLEALAAHARALREQGEQQILCGDLNVTRGERDVHPKERKPGAIGQRPEERRLLSQVLDAGLVDVGRALDPDNDGLFTWWAPWRNLRQRNIGWRIDFVLASPALAARATASRVLADLGTSDHAPVVASFAPG